MYFLDVVVFWFLFWFFIYLFIFGLLLSWFSLCVCYVIVCFCSYSFIFEVAASGREGYVLSSFYVAVFFYFFSYGKRLFYFVGWVRDSSCAGQSPSYVSILEAYISFEGGCKGLAVNKNHYLLLYISQLHFY